MSPQELKELLPVLRDCRVSRLKLGDLEINLVIDSLLLAPQNILVPQVNTSSSPPAPLVSAPTISTEKVEDVVVPQSLEEEVPYDDLLFHSAPGDRSLVPLTGDRPAEPPSEGKPNG